MAETREISCYSVNINYDSFPVKFRSDFWPNNRTENWLKHADVLIWLDEEENRAEGRGGWWGFVFLL